LNRNLAVGLHPPRASGRSIASAGWQGIMKPGGLERDRIGRETRQSIRNQTGGKTVLGLRMYAKFGGITNRSAGRTRELWELRWLSSFSSRYSPCPWLHAVASALLNAITTPAGATAADIITRTIGTTAIETGKRRAFSGHGAGEPTKTIGDARAGSKCLTLANSPSASCSSLSVALPPCGRC